MLRLEMLPAAHGDCLWIEYGSGTAVHRILIDGGPAHTYPALRERILHLPANERRFDLLVITHVDADHIEGVIRLLLDAEALHCRFDRIWFNGRDQLNAVPDPAGEPLGALQGEILGVLIADYEARTGSAVWNLGFDQALAAIDRRHPTLPAVDLPGDCRLTLLSPDHERLLNLKDRWKKELDRAGIASGDVAALRTRLAASRSLRPLGDVLGAEDKADEVEAMSGRHELPEDDDSDLGAELEDTLGRGSGEPGADAPFGGDTSAANGSSIALLLEYPATAPEVRLLLAGDAWPGVLETSLATLLGDPAKRFTLDAFKLPHHGSVANLSPGLLDRLRCSHYLVSTSGALFRHPHKRALDLILEHHAAPGRPTLHFNYLTRCTAPWSDTADQARRSYRALHPKGHAVSF
ncbi:hypothetical protein [Thauera humireducens]|uniref:Metallo-beta-lactamase domain-containing protein n=2 Tax=Thauera humireducens TaxID=1134435 RepID=A0A127K3F7_9RHOO|nr:hypothetical protein [Thauera humireducens]AMO36485.1 hypothetical protein AC731_005765 [Thauera humireducens]